MYNDPKMPYHQLYYHIVWGVKQRLPLLRPEYEAAVYKIIAQKIEDVGGRMLAVGNTTDHIHLVASLSPVYALARVIGMIKGSTSHYINHVLDPDANFAWKNEYGLFTVSPTEVPRIIAYVQYQKAHHREGKILPGFEMDG